MEGGEAIPTHHTTSQHHTLPPLVPLGRPRHSPCGSNASTRVPSPLICVALPFFSGNPHQHPRVRLVSRFQGLVSSIRPFGCSPLGGHQEASVASQLIPVADGQENIRLVVHCGTTMYRTRRPSRGLPWSTRSHGLPHRQKGVMATAPTGAVGEYRTGGDAHP